jgi:hypothetical protein
MMNDLPKVVLSRTLREVKCKNSRRASGSVEEEVARLEAGPAGASR